MKESFLGLMDVDGVTESDHLVQGYKNTPTKKNGSKVKLTGMCDQVYDRASGRYRILSGTGGGLKSSAHRLVLVIMKL